MKVIVGILLDDVDSLGELVHGVGMLDDQCAVNLIELMPVSKASYNWYVRHASS